jgi:hypothetical protein
VGRSRHAARRLAMAGVVALVAGGTLIGTAVTASATSPVVALSASTGLTAGQHITVNGTGFSPKQAYFIQECNTDPSAPTVPVPGFPKTKATTPDSVGCSAPQTPSGLKTDKAGAFEIPFPFIIANGTVGPPATGTDSAGNDAATDAAKFPCPANPAGTGCAIVVTDAKGVVASAAITVVAPKPPPPPPPPPPTSCSPSGSKTVTESASAGSGTGSLTISPVECVSAGTHLTLTASGLLKSDLGSLLECNTSTGEPTVSFSGNAIPVGCTNATAKLFTTTASGGLPAGDSFTVAAGVVGPPASGTDSAGHSAAADAANYPCPATKSTGGGCAIVLGDLAPAAGPAKGAAAPAADPSGGDQIVVPIAFSTTNPGTTSPGGGSTPPGGSTSPATGTQTGATSSSSGGSGASSTAASSSSLAFTGSGPGLRGLAGVGLVLLGLGCLLMALGDSRKRLILAFTPRGIHTRRQ